MACRTNKNKENNFVTISSDLMERAHRLNTLRHSEVNPNDRRNHFVDLSSKINQSSA